MAQSKRSRVARLMLKAVRSLPEKEQEVVLEYLVESGLASPVETPESTKRSAHASKGHIGLGAPEEENVQLLLRGGPGPATQMVPVRLSAPQHRLLKEWCAENGFSMAVVVRGLVERFLEDQERRAA